MATSSAVRLADLALVWDGTRGDADLTLIDSDLATDAGLVTAALLSLFLDRRAEADDKPPSGDPNDRRGWWADAFAAVAGDRYGSRLWLLARAKRTNETILLAKQYTLEALQWMIEDRVVAGVEVLTEDTNRALLTTVGLQRPGRDPVAFRFAHVWNSLEGAL
jgi:phage gp46-like protein